MRETQTKGDETMLTTTTILIKRNQDRNYDRLWTKIDAASIFRMDSLSERETPDGYAVTLKYVDQDVLNWVESRPRDFAIL
jgi:hypothetical protein